MGPGRSAGAHVAEWNVAVDFRFFGKTQYPLAYDVALDLIRATANRGEIGIKGEEVCIVRAREFLAVEQRVRAEQCGAQARLLMQDARHRKLAQRHDGRRGAG